jgi:DegV family protein with EDD domain
MAGIGIVTDSTSYMTDDYIRENDIKVVPLKVIFDDESFREGVDISNDEFYARLREPGVFPTTSQPSAGEFLEAYREMSQRYDSLISIHISSGISGTYESALSAASEMGDYPIEVIDSRFVSLMVAMFIDDIIKDIGAGKGIEEIKALTGERIGKSNVMFCVDTLEYLHRGGRIGGAQAFMGSMLRIKPILYIDGTIDALDKVRGSKKALERLVEISREKLGGKKARLGFTHVQAKERMMELMELAKGSLKFDHDEVFFNETGPVVGSHVGPGTVGIGFYPLD